MPRLHDQVHETPDQRDQIRLNMMASPECKRSTDGSIRINHPTHIISLGEQDQFDGEVRFRCKRSGECHGLIKYQTDYVPNTLRIMLAVTHPDSTISAPDMYKALVMNGYAIISDQAMSIGGLKIYQALLSDPEVALSLRSGRKLSIREFVKNFGEKGTSEGDDRFVAMLSPVAAVRRFHETAMT